MFRIFAAALGAALLLPADASARRPDPPTNQWGLPVLDEQGQPIRYTREQLKAVATVEDEATDTGYLLPSGQGGGRRKRLATFAIDDLTAEEEEELLKYLAFLRSRKTSA